jgi:thiamine-monophosphate kinase
MEAEFLSWLKPRLFAAPHVTLGVGDDGAIVAAAPGTSTVVAVDLLTDGVDFRLSEVDPRRVGRKALAVNLSDLAAMAARPMAAFVSLALPRRGALELAQSLYEGLLPLAEQFACPIAGGDTNTWDGSLVVSVTVLGQVGPRGGWRRDGARGGDAIVATGQFGGSILGHHFDFEPRVALALDLAERYTVHAAIDISDGLALDLSRLAEASLCGAEVDLTAVPISEAAYRHCEEHPDHCTPLDHALGDGEDFELLLAMPVVEADRLRHDPAVDVPISILGRFVEGRGLWQITAAGHRPLPAQGFQHRGS